MCIFHAISQPGILGHQSCEDQFRVRTGMRAGACSVKTTRLILAICVGENSNMIPGGGSSSGDGGDL